MDIITGTTKSEQVTTAAIQGTAHYQHTKNGYYHVDGTSDSHDF